jgi:hypothetical protein
MDYSIHIDQSPRLSLLIAAWRSFFKKLHAHNLLSDNGLQYLLAILEDKLQKAMDSEFNPLVLTWLKETLPKLLKCRGTLNLINQVPAALWTSDYIFRCNYIHCFEHRSNQLTTTH